MKSRPQPYFVLTLLFVSFSFVSPAHAALVTVDSIFQDGVNGADMAGSLLVTAFFDSGASETSPWAVTGAFTGATSTSTDWGLSVADAGLNPCPPGCADTQPLGTPGDASDFVGRGLWTLENTGSDPIAGLLLTGIGANPTTMTIFDQFFATDPANAFTLADFGTDGSFFGFDFLPRSAFAGTSNYMDEVALNGATPLFDVYATVGLEFDLLASGQSHTFWLDTDLARLSTVPEPTSLVLLATGILGLAASRRRVRP